MTWFEALILGLIQGLTEFLPVSSSGHLLIAKNLFGIETRDVTFEVTVHAATILATLVVFWPFIWDLVRNVLTFKWNPQSRYVCLLLLSLLPVMVVGLFFKDQVEAIFADGCLGLSALGVVGAALLLTAALLWLTQIIPQKEKTLNASRALGVGLAQALAVIPGLSRSGSTIATGLLLGLKKEEVARFSFLMVLIPVAGETLLTALDGGFHASASGLAPLSLAVGFCAAFVSGILACKCMLRLVAKAKLSWFALYCLLVGAACLLSSFL